MLSIKFSQFLSLEAQDISIISIVKGLLVLGGLDCISILTVLL